MTANRQLTSTLLNSRLLGQPPRPTRHREAGIALGSVGSCPHDPTCTWIVPDSSGSVSGVQGSDPIARRFEEARLALQAVALRCDCKQERVAIVHFDTPTSLDVPPTAFTRHGWRQIERGLAIPPDAAGQSLLRPSFETVREAAKKLPDHNHVLVALTDFQFFDDNLQGLYTDFAEFPGIVHAVSLRAAPPQQLVDDEQVVVTHITHDSQRGAVAMAVLAALTTHRI